MITESGSITHCKQPSADDDIEFQEDSRFSSMGIGQAEERLAVHSLVQNVSGGSAHTCYRRSEG